MIVKQVFGWKWAAESIVELIANELQPSDIAELIEGINDDKEAFADKLHQELSEGLHQKCIDDELCFNCYTKLTFGIDDFPYCPECGRFA